MIDEKYKSYLESVVISLLKERDELHKDITIDDYRCSSELENTTVNVGQLLELIKSKRKDNADE